MDPYRDQKLCQRVPARLAFAFVAAENKKQHQAQEEARLYAFLHPTLEHKRNKTPRTTNMMNPSSNFKRRIIGLVSLTALVLLSGITYLSTRDSTTVNAQLLNVSRESAFRPLARLKLIFYQIQ